MAKKTNNEIAKIGTQYGGVEGFLRIYSDASKEAAWRLINDTRMGIYWGHGFDAAAFEDATHVFELAQSRPAWELLTKREQDAWFRKFDQAVDDVAIMLTIAPALPTNDEGTPDQTMRDYMRYLQRAQHDLAIPQALSKPKDARAPRAFFLRQFQECQPSLSAVIIATVASVMFQEEVSDRKVRLHRPDGFSKKRKNPS